MSEHERTRIEALQAEWTAMRNGDQPWRDGWSADWARATAALCRVDAPGWVRLGRFDEAERRSLWAKIEDDAVWLASGREGDDSLALVSADNPVFAALRDVVERAIHDLTERDEQ